MAIGQTNVSMDDILDEKAGNPSIPLNRKNISLYGLSVDSVADYQDATTSASVDITGSPDQTAPYGMGEFRGWESTSFDGWPTGSGLNTVPDQQWAQASHNDPNTVQVGCNYGQFHDTNNDRIRHRWTTFTSAAASSFSYADQDYIGLDSAQFQAKADYSTTATAGGSSATFQNPASYSPASGTWTNTSTSGYSPVWQWTITINSGNANTAIITSQGYNVYFYNRATLNNVTYPSTADGYNGNQYYRSNAAYINLTAARSQFAQPIGP